jgi:uncharacterized protein
MYSIYAGNFHKIFDEYPEATDAILKNLEERGPLMPKECEFQARRADWKDHWSSPNVTKRILRGLWHSGKVMTAGRRNGQHLYDLTERVVPAQHFKAPLLEDIDARRQLMHERHRAVGIVSPTASAEMWSYAVMGYVRKELIQHNVDKGGIVPIDIEGLKAHATPEFLTLLDSPAPTPRVIFIAPLDQIMWDRKLVQKLFGFDYVWEIYVPEAKRKWGYYVLPVLFGDTFVARIEFYCRDAMLEIRNWHWEAVDPTPDFFSEFERSLQAFMAYSSATKIQVAPNIDPKIRDIALSVTSRVCGI